MGPTRPELPACAERAWAAITMNGLTWACHRVCCPTVAVDAGEAGHRAVPLRYGRIGDTPAPLDWRPGLQASIWSTGIPYTSNERIIPFESKNVVRNTRFGIGLNLDPAVDRGVAWSVGCRSTEH